MWVLILGARGSNLADDAEQLIKDPLQATVSPGGPRHRGRDRRSEH